MNIQIELQVFYEIAMELGAEADLQKTAKKALSAYLHRLGCSAGMIMRIDLSSASAQTKNVITVPRNLDHNFAYREVSAIIRNAISINGIKPLSDSLPLVGTSCETNYYIMELKDFGLLLLLKNGAPFDRSILHGISRLNKKLAQACLASLYTDRLEATVQERTKDLQETNTKLKDTLSKVNMLSGLLPICAGCKKIRDEKGYWNQIEAYVRAHSQADFTHALCPICLKSFYPEYVDADGKLKPKSSS